MTKYEIRDILRRILTDQGASIEWFEGSVDGDDFCIGFKIDDKLYQLDCDSVPEEFKALGTHIVSGRLQ